MPEDRKTVINGLLIIWQGQSWSVIASDGRVLGRFPLESDARKFAQEYGQPKSKRKNGSVRVGADGELTEDLNFAHSDVLNNDIGEKQKRTENRLPPFVRRLGFVALALIAGALFYTLGPRSAQIPAIEATPVTVPSEPSTTTGAEPDTSMSPLLRAVLYVVGAIVIGYLVIIIGIPLLEIVVAIVVGVFSSLLAVIIPIVVVIALIAAAVVCCSQVLGLQPH